MKTNKLFLATIIVAVALMGTANAASSLMPQPVGIKLSQPVVTQVTVTNTYTGEAQVVSTASDGATVVDLSNFEKGAVSGAVIRVEALGAKVEFTHTNQPYYDVYIDVGVQLAEKCVLTEYLDYGETLAVENDRCQVYVTGRAYTPVKCVVNVDNLKPGDTHDTVSDECDVHVTAAEQDNTLAAAVAAIFALLGGGYYLHIRKNSGEGYVGFKVEGGKTLHNHANARSYHDPNTVHKYQPHKKGELKPRYSSKKNADGKYDYLGDD